MPVSTILHKGKKVVLMDYTKCKSKEELLQMLRESEDYVNAIPDKSLTLSDFTGIHGNSEFMSAAKKASKDTFDHKVEKAAALGVTGLKKVLLTGYNMIAKNKVVPFDTKEQALDFLVE